MKTCTGCGENKPLEAFNLDKRTPSGRMARCKGCWNAAGRERYHRNLEHNRAVKRAAGRKRDPAARAAAMRQWRQENPDLARAARARDRERLLERHPDYFRDWYQQNIETERDRCREVMRQLREERPELGREARRRYRAKNPEAVRARERENTHRRRALKGKHSPELAAYMADLVEKPCAYCDTTANITVDHVIPLSRGGRHEANNLAPACISCNSSKCALLLSEWAGPPSLRRAA